MWLSWELTFKMHKKYCEDTNIYERFKLKINQNVLNAEEISENLEGSNP